MNLKRRIIIAQAARQNKTVNTAEMDRLANIIKVVKGK